MKAIRRIPFVLLVAAALTVALPQKQSNASYGMGGGEAVVILVLVAVFLIVKGIEAAAEANAKNSSGSGISKPTGSGATGKSAANKAAQHAYRARPLCNDVGGYEAYLKRTDKLCRLY